MANLTAEVTLTNRPRGMSSYVVANSVTVYAGSIVAVDANGFLNKYTAANATDRIAGVCLQTVTGNTSALPPLEARVNDTGMILTKVTVAGATSAATVNSLVYITTDNPTADLTTSAQTSRAVGFVVRWHSGTINDVQLFTMAEQQCLPA